MCNSNGCVFLSVDRVLFGSGRIRKFPFIFWGGMLTLLCVVAEAVLTIWQMKQIGEYREDFLSVFNVIPTMYIFGLAKSLGERLQQYLQKHAYLYSVIAWIGGCTFGVYLIGLWLQIRMIPVYYLVYKYIPNLPLVSSFVYVAVVQMTGIILVSLLKVVPGLKKII